MNLEVTAEAASHVLAVLRALLDSRWSVRHAPRGARLVRNGQLVLLRSKREDLRIRLFVYKVTGSGRGRPDERRIEITSTYQKGLRRLRSYRDIVLGYDADHRIFVGVDPVRIAHGGPTGNASSFFDQTGLSWSRSNEILIQQRAARLFQRAVEFHAFIKPPRLAEYLFNADSLHAGTYRGSGAYSGRIPLRHTRGRILVAQERTGGGLLELEGPAITRRLPTASSRLVSAYEQGNTRALRRRKISAADFEQVRRRLEENGRLGEEFAFRREKRLLRQAGKGGLAKRVRWVSLRSVGEGYDILSYTPAGQEKLVEVKSTSGQARNFEMTENEWRVCCANRATYYVYRVTGVRGQPRVREVFRNLVDLEATGRITRSATGWLVRCR